MRDKIVDFYTRYDEKSRLIDRHPLERIRSQEIISRCLGAGKSRILDIGGAAGVYSFWLASLGHEVDLIDLVPKHIEQAKETEEKSGIALASAALGDACDLSFADDSYDLVLLMGPLYHMVDAALRAKALREARRVLKKGGTLVCAAISRFASLLDGLLNDYVEDGAFKQIIARDLDSGRHINPTGEERYFTTAYFHLPDELRAEIEAAGFPSPRVLAVEGVGGCLVDVEKRLSRAGSADYLLECIRKTEEEPSILGISMHLLGIARK